MAAQYFIVHYPIIPLSSYLLNYSLILGIQVISNLLIISH